MGCATVTRGLRIRVLAPASCERALRRTHARAAQGERRGVRDLRSARRQTARSCTGARKLKAQREPNDAVLSRASPLSIGCLRYEMLQVSSTSYAPLT